MQTFHVSNIGYKACSPYYVEMLITGTNNEWRDVYDVDWAHYRTNEIKVIRICDDKGKTLDVKECKSTFYPRTLTYTVGQITSEPEYFLDKDQSEIRARGIHYFKTITAAIAFNIEYSCSMGYCTKFTGKMLEHNSYGKVVSTGDYVNGARRVKTREEIDKI